MTCFLFDAASLIACGSEPLLGIPYNNRPKQGTFRTRHKYHHAGVSGVLAVTGAPVVARSRVLDYFSPFPVDGGLKWEVSLFSLIYISQSLLAPDEENAQIEAIVSRAVAHNTEAGISGALLFTGARFAQVLEGPQAAVCDLMERIRLDPRHTDLIVIDQGKVPVRRFDGWSMAYSGRATFAARAVERVALERNDDNGFATRNLIRLMQELARSQGA